MKMKRIVKALAPLLIATLLPRATATAALLANANTHCTRQSNPVGISAPAANSTGGRRCSTYSRKYGRVYRQDQQEVELRLLRAESLVGDLEFGDAEPGSSVQSQARSLPPQGRANAIIRFVRQQSMVWRTSLLVSLLTAATRNVPFQRTRRDMLAGTIIFMVGDWDAQLLTHAKERRARRAGQEALGVAPSAYSTQPSLLGTFALDDNRFIISAVLGCFYAGICNPAVYNLAERLFPGVSPKLVLTKMAVSLSILSTVGNWFTMFFRRVAKHFLEDESASVRSILKGCWKSCNRDMAGVLKVDLKVWPLYDLLCFSLIPPTLRPITGALMASSWAMYMSIASDESH